MKEQIAINYIRMLGIEMVNKANSGHPGIVLGAAPIIYTIFYKFININPQDKTWINRDRFVMSAGHGSALLYSMLYVAGMGHNMEDLKQFRQLHSHTPGHPEYDISRGVEATSGPLGQGLAMSVGMALGEKFLAARFNTEQLALIDHYTYVLCSDGDLEEGISEEVITLAGHWRLNKLIVVYDSNHVQLDNMTSVSESVNIKQRFQAAHWNYLHVADGNDLNALEEAIKVAHHADKPTLIEVNTVIGLGATAQNTPTVHGAPLGGDIKNVYQYYHWEHQPFSELPDILKEVRSKIKKRSINNYDKWQALAKNYQAQEPSLWKDLSICIQRGYDDFDQTLFANLLTQNSEATRVSSGKVLNALSSHIKTLFGGSADLACSTKAQGADGNFQDDHRLGRNVCFGVREFGMAAIGNGLMLHGGLYPFVSTFFIFTDYLKPALRLSALMHIPTWYIMSHDSVLLGEDGPTHEPIEQLAMLRAQPNTYVFRPADMKETIGAYLAALKIKHSPCVFVVSRQNTPQLEATSITQVQKGAYVVYGSDEADVVITATGTEVALAVGAAQLLEKEHALKTKVISMVCRELLEQQDQYHIAKLYQTKNPAITVSLELAATLGWASYADYHIGINRFGYSAKAADIAQEVGFTPSQVVQKILTFAKKHQ